MFGRTEAHIVCHALVDWWLSVCKFKGGGGLPTDCAVQCAESTRRSRLQTRTPIGARVQSICLINWAFLLVSICVSESHSLTHFTFSKKCYRVHSCSVSSLSTDDPFLLVRSTADGVTFLFVGASAFQGRSQASWGYKFVNKFFGINFKSIKHL